MDGKRKTAIIETVELLTATTVLITFQPNRAIVFDADSLEALAQECHLPVLREQDETPH